MTKEQVEQSTQSKVQAIQTLCNQLDILITAEQAISEQGLIKNTVYFTDTEKYEMDKMPTPEIKTLKKKKNENTTPHK
jgi:translation elongation factor P/translation initiation factor 5A